MPGSTQMCGSDDRICGADDTFSRRRRRSSTIIGLGQALAFTRLISSLLFGLTPTDPLTIVLASLLMIASAALAGFLPARRACRVDPIIALRYE